MIGKGTEHLKKDILLRNSTSGSWTLIVEVAIKNHLEKTGEQLYRNKMVERFKAMYDGTGYLFIKEDDFFCSFAVTKNDWQFLAALLN